MTANTLKTLALTAGTTALFWMGASPAGAVDLINGDFATGDLTGWTVFTTPVGNNGPGLPDVVPFDTTIGTTSNSARFQVGSGGGGILQDVTLFGGLLNISVDVAAQGLATNSDGGTFALLLNNTVVDSFVSGTILTGGVKRDTLTASVPVGAGVNSIGLQITRLFSNSADSPLQYATNFAISGPATQPNTSVPEPDLGMALLTLGGLGILIRRVR
ncbi:hypothetical protein V0288_23490 [Pannus brasiliensis CCIBt3594]|uniref:Ice-binding protein C-terminal domain-containing protein n=1 Tax=Pannus brasiliensis CCIBt3594 TaxID=1427578 RepID=A0AAW9QSR4_9CHRO